MKDPRHRNTLFDASSLQSYKEEYARSLQEAIASLDNKALEDACREVSKAASDGKRIFALGNGGSAAIADHLCCDWTKGTNCDGHPPIRTQSLTANVALYTAIANDFGFSNALSTQVEYFCDAGDILIAISSSGNSVNILNAVEVARQRGVYVIGLSGFGGGRLAEMSDASLCVSARNYGIVEDAHQAVMHIIAQFTVIERESSSAMVSN